MKLGDIYIELASGVFLVVIDMYCALSEWRSKYSIIDCDHKIGITECRISNFEPSYIVAESKHYKLVNGPEFHKYISGRALHGI